MGAADILAWVIDHASLVMPSTLPAPAIPEDPADEQFLACAVEASADVIISGDRHLPALGEYRSIPILRARAFLGSSAGTTASASSDQE